jgi:hypothetical protein
MSAVQRLTVTDADEAFHDVEFRDRDLDQEFCDLLCADELLIADEFAAIIAANWPYPPRGRPIRFGPPCAAGRWPRRVRDPGSDVRMRPTAPSRAGHGRQRSPPVTEGREMITTHTQPRDPTSPTEH